MARRIGFDAVRALRNTTGLGNYARRLIQGLAATGLIEPLLYSPLRPRAEFRNLPGSLRLPPTLWRGRGARTLWRTFRMGRAAAADGVELFHGLSHEIPRDLPRSGVPSVVSFLDLLWVRFPGLYRAVDRRSYEWRYRWSAERARAIVAVSRHTRRELLELYGVDPAKVVVVPPPSDPRFAQPIPEADRRRVLERHGLREPFMLSVGTFEARKNQRTALVALAELDPARTPPLVLVGRDGGTRRELVSIAERSGLRERVQLRSEVSAEELPALVQSAALFLYPSLVEGFGLPIVEALAAGVPVIASTGGCFPEAGGPGSRYVPATDAAALAGEIRRVLDNPPVAERMIAAGRRHAERFAPRRIAARMLAVYDAVLAERRLPADELDPGPEGAEH